MMLKNIKLRVHSPEHSASFQREIFKRGGSWINGDKDVRLTSKEFLIVDNDGKLFASSDEQVYVNSASTAVLHIVRDIVKIPPPVRGKL